MKIKEIYKEEFNRLVTDIYLALKYSAWHIENAQ